MRGPGLKGEQNAGPALEADMDLRADPTIEAGLRLLETESGAREGS